MIEKIKKYYHEYQLRGRIAEYRKIAEFGEMNSIKYTARIVNDSGIKSHIQIGERTIVSGTLMTTTNGKIKIGSYCHLVQDSFIGAANYVEIGDYVAVARYSHIFDNNNHPVDPEERIQHRLRVSPGGDGYSSWGTQWELSANAPVIIENNVWIGMYCYIGKGVRIGEGSIVARNSVVVKDVPPYTIVAGNPAKVVKKLR
jgi:acetyltransferase-like isoleucine patch superfamily enzyme